MNKKVKFLDDVISLCRAYGLCIVSNDPYVGIDVADYDSSNEDMYEGLILYLTFHKDNG